MVKKRTKGRCLSVSSTLYSSPIVYSTVWGLSWFFPLLWVFHVIYCVPILPSVFCVHFVHTSTFRLWPNELANKILSETDEEEQEERWIEAWRARFQQRSSIEPTTRLGLTRCTSTCSGTAAGVMSKELMTRHPNKHIETSRRGSNRRAGYYIALHRVWANRC